MEELPKIETSVERWKAVTADVLRPIPYMPAPPPPPAPQPVAGEKPDFAAVLLRGKWLILAMTILGTLFGAYRVIKQVPLYGASTTLELMTPNTAFMGQGRFDPQGQDSYIINTANLQTQLRIILGPALLRRAQERVSLESPLTAPPAGGMLGKLRARLHLLPQENMDYLHAAINTAAHSTTARQVGTTKLIEVTCLSISAETAANYINALASEYIAQGQQTRNSQATRTLQFLSTQLEDAKSRMDEADTKLQEFLRTGGRAFVLDPNTLDDSKLKMLQTDLAASQNDRIQKETRWQMAKASPVDSLPEILDDGTLKSLNAQMTTLRKQRAELIATLTPNHYKVQRVDAQIAELEQTIKQEKSNTVKRIQNEYEAALNREKLMTQAYNRQTQTVAGETEKTNQYLNLKRAADTERTTYNALLQQTNEMNVIAAVPSSSARVIDAATPIYRPVKPKPPQDISLAGFGGFAIAVVFLVLKEWITVKKRSRVFAAPGSAGQVLNIPELGILPAFEGPAVATSKFGLKMLSATPNDAPAGAPISWSKQPFLAESIRHAFASIRARNGDGTHRLFIVTSASPSEGKTTLIGNLGVAIAESGHRVLIIDADLRAPRLAGVFGLEPKIGLSDIYAEDVPIQDIRLERYIKPSDTPNLSVLTSGDADLKTTGELPFSRRIRELFVRLRKDYDYILVDTPPSLPFSDARLLGQISDGVILVIRSGISSRESVSLTVRRFADDGVPIVGTILNDWQPTKTGTAYGDYFLNGYRGNYSGYNAPKA